MVINAMEKKRDTVNQERGITYSCTVVRDGNPGVTFKQLTGRERSCGCSGEEHSRQIEEQGEKQEAGPEQGNQVAGTECVKGSRVGDMCREVGEGPGNVGPCRSWKNLCLTQVRWEQTDGCWVEACHDLSAVLERPFWLLCRVYTEYVLSIHCVYVEYTVHIVGQEEMEAGIPVILIAQAEDRMAWFRVALGEVVRSDCILGIFRW